MDSRKHREDAQGQEGAFLWPPDTAKIGDLDKCTEIASYPFHACQLPCAQHLCASGGQRAGGWKEEAHL